MNAPRFNVLGLAVSAITLTQTRDLVLSARGQQRLGYICLATVHGVSEAHADEQLRRIFNSSWLTLPDGMPLVWLGRWHGHRQITRVYGPDLMFAVCDAGRAIGLTHYFYGGKPGVAEELRRRLTARFPGLAIAGSFTPPFRPLTAGEQIAWQEEIAAKKPDIIWVGLGTPKQERFMAEQWARLDTALLIGVGAAFDFHSGQLRQAPRWMQRSGLEWLFRLMQEPRRLWRRYLINNSLFVGRLALQLSGLRKYPEEGE
jgi:N-acetylglucosaminyldiphosphoundecaprenol N-acetyl-beta-D-mannosaminyltransferase